MDSLNEKDIRDILEQIEIDKSQEAFKAFDKDGSGTIDKDELKKVLEEMGQKPQDEEIIKMISEVDTQNKGVIDFNDFLKVIAYHKQCQQNNDESDTLDAFIAMGGNPDKSGKVDAKELIRIIRDEFKMTIDIERLIKEIDTDGSGEIEYDEFKALLSNY